MNKTFPKTNLVFFYSEGYPNDNALDLSENKQLVINAAKDNVDEISYYTPKILREGGWGKYVKEYESTGLVSANKGMSKIGFCAWRPLILLLELEKMNDGDILIYRDSNIKKYPKLADYKGIKYIADQCLSLCGFDFFVPHHDITLKNRQLTKTNVIRELGENELFSYEYPALMAGFIVIRKSAISKELLEEWLLACENDEWINGEQYGELDTEFHHFTPEQGILSVIIANWIRRNKYNIPIVYPLISIRSGRNINIINFRGDYSYLSILNKSKAIYTTNPDYLENENLNGLMSFVKTIMVNFIKKQKYQILKSYNKKFPSNKIEKKIIKIREYLGKE